jgi:RNA polymerase sigma factor for flagellar operon FliA
MNVSERLILSQIPMVRSLARRAHRRCPPSVMIDDLESDGYLGLVKAVARYEDQRGAALSTYATYAIKGAILDGLRRQDFISRHFRRLLRQDQAVRDELRRELQRTPDRSEIETRLGRQLQAVSVEVGLRECKPEPRLPDTPESLYSKVEQLAGIRARVQKLPLRLQSVVRMRYWEEQSFAEIGKVLGVTESCAHQLNSHALRLLKGEFQ